MSSRIAIDIETNWRGNGSRGSPYYDDIVLIQVNDGKTIQVSDEVSDFEDLLSDPDIIKIFHNGAFDIQYLCCNAFDLRIENVWDTMLAERLIYLGNNNISVDLASVVQRRCDVILNKEVRETFKGSVKGKLSQRQIEYGKEDVRYLLDIHTQQKKDVSDRNLDHIMWVENSLAPISARMQLIGIDFDEDIWNEMMLVEKSRIPFLERQIWDLLESSYYLDIISGQYVGTLNIDSTKQLKRAFQRLGVDINSTSESVLLGCGHPAAKVVLEYRERTKRLTWNYPKFINPFTNRIHADIYQMGARSGRFSYRDPNLQQVPKDQMFRSMFIASPGCVFVAADYGQQEMRILAELARCPNLISVCESQDPHLENARLIFNDPTIEKSDPRRDSAKNTGFALMYGSSLRGFVRGVGLTEDEARGPYSIFKKKFSRVDEWGQEQLQFIMEYGYSLTAGGRRRHFQNVTDDPGKYATIARNNPIQGTAADMLKLAMVYIDQKLYDRGIPGDIILCVHDEVIVETPEFYAEEVKGILEREMVRAGEHYVTVVPTIAEAIISRCWQK